MKGICDVKRVVDCRPRGQRAGCGRQAGRVHGWMCGLPIQCWLVV